MRHKTLDEARAAMLEARRGFDEVQEKLVTLTAKADNLQGEIPRLTEKLTQAKTAKEKALDGFVAGSLTQEELNTAREAYDLVQKSHSECSELAEAVFRATRKVEGDLPRIGREKAEAESRVWVFISDELRDKIRSMVEEELPAAFAAYRAAGGDDFSNFTRNLFACPKPDDVKSARVELMNKYEI